MLLCDDFTLLILLSHPSINLRCILVNPGTKLQIGFVKLTLEKLGFEIPVGSRVPDYSKNCLSGFYFKICPKTKEMDADGLNHEILAKTLTSFPDLNVLTGGALTDIAIFLDKYPDMIIKRLVSQGGFAGDNLVSKNHRLKGFDGRITCPTYNFNADRISARKVLDSKQILAKVLCSKNVCHGVKYDSTLHEKIKKICSGKGTGLDMIYKGMSIYLEKKRIKKIS